MSTSFIAIRLLDLIDTPDGLEAYASGRDLGGPVSDSQVEQISKLCFEFFKRISGLCSPIRQASVVIKPNITL